MTDPSQDPYAPPREEVASSAPRPGSDVVTFGDVASRFRLLIGSQNGPLMFVWIGVALVMLLVSFASTFLESQTALWALVAQFAVGVVNTVAVYASLACFPAVVASRGDVSLNRVTDICLENLGMVAIVGGLFHVATLVGSMCLVAPGLLVTFLWYPAPFLSAAKGSGVSEAFSLSFDWTKKHHMIGLLTFAMFVVISIAIAIPFYVLFMTATVYTDGGFADALTGNPWFSNFAIWGVSVFLGYFSWLWTGSILATMAEKEGVLNEMVGVEESKKPVEVF